MPFKKIFKKKYPIRRKPFVRKRGSQFGKTAHLRVKLRTSSRIINQVLDDSFYAFKWALRDFSNYDKYATAFDKYRIVDMMVRFQPMYRSNQVYFEGGMLSDNQPTRLPLIYTAVDNTDNRLPSFITELQGYSNCKVHSDEKGFYVKLTPKILNYVFNGSSQSAGSSYSPWLTCITSDISYFGLKVGILGHQNEEHDEATGQRWNVDFQATVLFKHSCKYSAAEEANIEAQSTEYIPDNGPDLPVLPTTTEAPTTEPPPVMMLTYVPECSVCKCKQ